MGEIVAYLGTLTIPSLRAIAVSFGMFAGFVMISAFGFGRLRCC